VVNSVASSNNVQTEAEEKVKAFLDSLPDPLTENSQFSKQCLQNCAALYSYSLGSGDEDIYTRINFDLKDDAIKDAIINLSEDLQEKCLKGADLIFADKERRDEIMQMLYSTDQEDNEELDKIDGWEYFDYSEDLEREEPLEEQEEEMEEEQEEELQEEQEEKQQEQMKEGKEDSSQSEKGDRAGPAQQDPWEAQKAKLLEQQSAAKEKADWRSENNAAKEAGNEQTNDTTPSFTRPSHS
jgi:hypothetical protein